MGDYTKTIHEFYYVIGLDDFSTHNILKVNRETDKMLYGDVLDYAGVPFGRFALNKRKLNVVDSISDRKYGLVYRVQIDDSSETEARVKAKEIVYTHLIEIAENFKKES